MPDAVILQFRKPVTIDLQPALGVDVQPPTELLFPCTPGPAVLFPMDLWPAEISDGDSAHACNRTSKQCTENCLAPNCMR